MKANDSTASDLECYAFSPNDYRAAILDALQEMNVHLENISLALQGKFDDID